MPWLLNGLNWCGRALDAQTREAPPPIILLGPPRSNSTLIHRLLAHHTEVVAPSLKELVFPGGMGGVLRAALSLLPSRQGLGGSSPGPSLFRASTNYAAAALPGNFSPNRHRRAAVKEFGCRLRSSPITRGFRRPMTTAAWPFGKTGRYTQNSPTTAALRSVDATNRTGCG